MGSTSQTQYAYVAGRSQLMARIRASPPNSGTLEAPNGLILDSCWHVLAYSWPHVGPSWPHLEPTSADLGPSWPHLGPSLADLCPYLAPLWSPSALILPHIGLISAPLGLILAHLDSVSTPFGLHLGPILASSWPISATDWVGNSVPEGLGTQEAGKRDQLRRIISPEGWES